jgi:hypothetical protein
MISTESGRLFERCENASARDAIIKGKAIRWSIVR